MSKYQVEIKFKRPEHNGAQWVSALYKDFGTYEQAVKFYHKYDDKDFVEKRYFRAKLGSITLFESDKGTTLPVTKH